MGNERYFGGFDGREVHTLLRSQSNVNRTWNA